jgi:tRNA(adenine34) deaminase
MMGPVEDERWMGKALELAAKAALRDEVPVGAVLVGPAGQVAANHNRTRELSDPTAHAEILTLREAGQVLGDWRLTDHTLYVTLEPCAMCAGALVLGRIARLVFAASDPKAGMCGSLGNLAQDERLNHRVEITSGVLAADAAEQLRRFFRERR